MGSKISCFDDQYIHTVQDTSTRRSWTDDELTVFLANEKYLQEDQKHAKENPVRRLLFNLKFQNPSSLGTKISKLQLNSDGSALTKTKSEKSLKKCHSRIYSSNAVEPGINVIDRIQKFSSYCSTNINSLSTSRCVSPLSKNKSPIIE